jgi:hypothetical protein
MDVLSGVNYAKKSFIGLAHHREIFLLETEKVDCFERDKKMTKKTFVQSKISSI